MGCNLAIKSTKAFSDFTFMSVVILSSPMSNIIIYKVSLEEFIFVILLQHLIRIWINIVSSCFNNMDEIGNY